MEGGDGEMGMGILDLFGDRAAILDQDASLITIVFVFLYAGELSFY